MLDTFPTGRHGASDYAPHVELDVDVAILGAGAGGCAAAAALTERGLRVPALEEGSHWPPHQFKPSSIWAFRNLYQGRGTRAAHGNGILALPGGRGVGGSTLVNSAICFRTPPSVLARWRDESGCSRFTDAWMDQCFDRIWTTLRRPVGSRFPPAGVQRPAR